MTIIKNGTDGFIKIGNVVKKIYPSKSPHLIPLFYLPENLTATLTQHLQWILQKDVLGQDVFLIGPPGKTKRQLALMYSELTQQEVEYVSLSRDVTESDLKQRREIRNGSAVYADECAVRAALSGRLLILEGLEKAERNVLPVLNNLLENREVQLEDGRFIMHPDRFDYLLGKHGPDTMEQWRLLRCSPLFRVLALALPVPRYRGNPLDPPLRSRFQCRDVRPQAPGFGERPPSDKVLQLTSFGLAVNAEEARSLNLPDFPADNLDAVMQLWNLVPAMPVQFWLQRLYPVPGLLSREAGDAVQSLAKKFEVNGMCDHASQLSLVSCSASEEEQEQTVARVQLKLQGSLLSKQASLTVPRGSLTPSEAGSRLRDSQFVTNSYHGGLLADLLVTHAGSDFALIGPRGCGKSAVIGQLARLLGYRLTHVALYKDMSSRDLLQQRATDERGDTEWRHSALVQAAVRGDLAVLDGLHRVDAGTFSVLARLLHDRELCLSDGSRLLRHDRYDGLRRLHGWSDDDMASRGLLRIHPAFRVVGIGEVSTSKHQANQWLSSEMLAAFLFHPVRSLSADEEFDLLLKLVPDAAGAAASDSVRQLVDFAHSLRGSADSGHASLGSSLSTRQLLRLTRCLAAKPDTPLRELVESACLSRFLPRLAAQSLSQCLDEAGMSTPADADGRERRVECRVDGDRLQIGSAVADLPPDLRNEMKIPETLFYDNQAHLRVMESMLRDFCLGEHLLLIGNQGVGKNKVADQFLKLLRRPREYIQLHRDTTVHTLTLQPTVVDGVIRWRDSPLVRACSLGHVLVVDEADKAPTHVTCVLKSLVESGEMQLADGRRIVPPGSAEASDSVVVTHPDFRLVVLANRPGFPFLGNDFFAALGDSFACHPVDNPQFESEMEMLSRYGPDVAPQLLSKLVNVFADLRALSDDGAIQYPYSTRELVNIVRHLQKFPEERLSSVLQNVFDFDSHNADLRSTLASVLQRHGIPADSVQHSSMRFGKQFKLESPGLVGSTNLVPHPGGDRQLTVSHSDIEFKGPVTLPTSSVRLDGGSGRGQHFSELDSYVFVPLEETDGVSDLCVTQGPDGQPAVCHVATLNPLRVCSVPVGSSRATLLDLSDLFPETGNTLYRPRLRLLSVGEAMPHHFLCHEETTNVLLLIDSSTNRAARIRTPSLAEHPLAASRDLWRRPARTRGSLFRLVDSPALGSCAVVFQQNRKQVEILDLAGGSSVRMQLPTPIADLRPLTNSAWLVAFADDSARPCVLMHHPEQDGGRFSLLQQEEPVLPSAISWSRQLDSGDNGSSTSVLLHPGCHLSLLDLAPPNAEGLHRVSLRSIPSLPQQQQQQQQQQQRRWLASPTSATGQCCCTLPEARLVVRAVPASEAPSEALDAGHLAGSGLLEVTDLGDVGDGGKGVSYLPVEPPSGSLLRSSGRYSGWVVADLPPLFAQPAGGDLVSVDQSGSLCSWQVAPSRLSAALADWQQLLGAKTASGSDRQILIERRLPSGASGLAGPKHGRIDAKGAPHVGGNTWAGGTGGRDTAGLGGVGGPYRLDAGHHVYQVPDEVKEAVPREVREAAREMALKAWRDRLREIEMSEHDGEQYAAYLGRVKQQVATLRAVLQSLEAKGKERSWLRHQTQGDLDDGKLIEGLVGERAVYRRRGERPPELGAPPEKPKLVRVLVDVSGSMYRFNGHDQRLERQLEACLMLMEAFDGFDSRLSYEFRGHSGEGPDWSFTSAASPPANQKQRLDALKAMLAHSQFCLSGDHTLEAVDTGVRQLAAKEEADERFLIVFSDANLDRYGIHPRQLAKALTQEPKVTACAIFIGSIGNQAAYLRQSLPSGHAFVCLDNATLPLILQQFFTSTLVASD